MSEGPAEALIRELQQSKGEDANARVFGGLIQLIPRDPHELALALSRAVRDEHAAGGLRTSSLLALLAMTRVPSREFLELSLGVLREFGAARETPWIWPAVGAAAIVAQTDPRALLPDVAALSADPSTADRVDKALVPALLRLITYSSELLAELREGAFLDLVRWLWHDLAAHDIKTLADFVGFCSERGGSNDEMLALLVALADQLRIAADDKRYVAQRLEAAGAGAELVEQAQSAWRAMHVSGGVVDPGPAQGSDPPPPEPRIDEALALFCESGETEMEIGRVLLDQMFESHQPPPGLAYWVLATVDVLPAARRKSEIEYALLRIRAMLHGCNRWETVPCSVLQRWLDTPQLLGDMTTMAALELLVRKQPGLTLRHYAHRIIAASEVEYAWLVAEPLWRAIVHSEPGAVLMMVSRWFAAGFESREFMELLLKQLMAESHHNPELIAQLESSLVQGPEASERVIEMARTMLRGLRDAGREMEEP